MSLRLTLLRAPLRASATPSLRPLPRLPVLRYRTYSEGVSSTASSTGSKEGEGEVKKKRVPPPPRPPLEPTTFDGKASPRDVHNRPGLRGIPSTVSPWEIDRQHSRPRSNRAGPRPAPRPKLEEHLFNESAAPRAIYQRPTRDLPQLNSRWGLVVTAALVGLGAWGLFILYATNNERYSSSVVRQVVFQLRNSADVTALLGDHVKFARNFWGFGEPWIAGNINLMQGRIDVKFRMKGDKQEGTVYFTSIRPTAGAPWRIVRYKVISEYGETLRLDDKFVRPVVPEEDVGAIAEPAGPATPSIVVEAKPAEPVVPAPAPVQVEVPTKASLWKPEARAV